MPSSVQTERTGVAAVFKFAQQAGWFFRELPNPDEGIDALLEAPVDGRPGGHLIGLQIKSGLSYFDEPVDGGWRYRIEPRHRDYWRRFSLPVVLVLYNPEVDTAYWQPVLSQTLRQIPSGRHTIDVPASHELTAAVFSKLEALATAGLPRDDPNRDEALRGRRAEFDIGWMEMLAAGSRLFLEAEQPLAAAAPARLTLVAEDKSGRQTIQRDWPWAFLPGEGYVDALAEIFPWAKLSIDTRTYRRETYPAFIAEFGEWSEEDDAYVFERDFEDWFEEEFAGGSLRPYGRRAGEEVALWRLQLSLNQLGTDTLHTERQAMYDEAAFDFDLDDLLALQRAKGWYESDVFESAPFEYDAVVFVAEGDEDFEERTALLMARRLWDSETGELRAAAAILRHALGHSPTEALAQAFRKRYLCDDEPLSLEYANLKDWLTELDFAALE